MINIWTLVKNEYAKILLCNYIYQKNVRDWDENIVF